MIGQHCESYDVKRETVHCYPVNSSLLTAVARDGWNLSAVFKILLLSPTFGATDHAMTHATKLLEILCSSMKLSLLYEKTLFLGTVTRCSENQAGLTM